MNRVLLAGLPRSGTTWLAQVLSSAPGATYVHEPDNAQLEPFAHIAHAGLGPFPVIAPGAHAPRDYELMWDVAFAGGFPGAGAAGVDRLRAVGSSPRVPRPLRATLHRGAARVAARGPAPAGPVLVKTVRAFLSLEWLADRFDTGILVVWRHPVNLLAGWLAQGWTTADAARQTAPVEARFGSTDLWPPPAEAGPGASAWACCALTVLLLEAAERNPVWVVSSHEAACVDPASRLLELLERLGLPSDGRIGDTIAELNRPGTGFETRRLTQEEPTRWRGRLDTEIAATAWRTVERFAADSPVAARHWAAAPVGEPV